jgi:hypothetical protein
MRIRHVADAGRFTWLPDLQFCDATSYRCGAITTWAMPRAAGRGGVGDIMLKKLNEYPVLKYSLIAGAALLWLIGLSDQLGDLMQTAKYVGISLLLVAVAVI